MEFYNHKKIVGSGDSPLWTREKKAALKEAESNLRVGEKIAFQNDAFIVWTIHLPVGESLPFHKHSRPYFWTAMASGRSRSFYNNGLITETEYTLGDTKYFKDINPDNYFIHNLENIGNTMLIFTTVEFLNK